MKIKKKLFLAGAAIALLVFTMTQTMAQTNYVPLGTGTQMRIIPTTTAFTRALLSTNENVGSLLQNLNIPPGITNFVISTIAPAGQYVQVGNSTNLVGTLNGANWTNLNGAAITGSLTNNTTGYSSGATNVFPGVSITNMYRYWSNSSTTEWGYSDTNGVSFESNFTSGVWSRLTPTNVFMGIGSTTNINMNALNGQIYSTNITWSLTSSSTTNASMTGTAMATNDSRIVALTNLTDTFQGTFSGTNNGVVLFNANGTGVTNLTAAVNEFNYSTISAATNLAALSRISNPLVSGAAYTTPNAQGFIVANLICTNNANGWLTNITTGAVQFVGSITQNGTNYFSYMMRCGPNEIVCVTNKTGTLAIQGSEWRP